MTAGFHRTTGEIVAQCDSGIISTDEARTALSVVAKRATYDAAYSDHYASYWRYTRLCQEARRALAAL